MSKYAEQCAEWQAIGAELIEQAGGGGVSAFQVTEEQRRRLYARDDRMMTYDEIVRELTAN